MHPVRLLQRWTLPTQMVTASICAGTGDLIHQLGFEEKRLDEIEVRRRLLLSSVESSPADLERPHTQWYKTRRLMAYGGLVFAPCSVSGFGADRVSCHRQAVSPSNAFG